MSKLFESRAAVLENEARARVLEKEIELAKLKASQRTWVGLTDEEIASVANNNHPLDGIRSFARAIEAKLKELNS
jgi:hypothetical protein